MMQYILTEEEYNSLQSAANSVAAARVKLTQEFCTLVADTMPVKFWGNREPEVWGCILTVRERTGGHDWYCDECPAKKFCPYPSKSWSK